MFFFSSFFFSCINRVQQIAKLDHFAMLHLVDVKTQLRVLLMMAQLPILVSVFVHAAWKGVMLHRGCIVMQQLALVLRNYAHQENIGKSVVSVV